MVYASGRFREKQEIYENFICHRNSLEQYIPNNWELGFRTLPNRYGCLCEDQTTTCLIVDHLTPNYVLREGHLLEL
jgi:hypothetical protein